MIRKETTIAILLFLLIPQTKLMAQFEGTVGFGTQTVYRTTSKDFGVGAHLLYYNTNNLRFMPSFSYFPKKDKKMSSWMADAEMHYIIPASPTASLYPIGGINLSQQKQLPQNSGDSQSSLNPTIIYRPGINLGLGVQYDIAFRVRANFDLKYQIMKECSQVVLSGGFGFWF